MNNEAVETLKACASTFGAGLATLGAVLLMGAVFLFAVDPVPAWNALIAAVVTLGVGASVRVAAASKAR